MFANRYTAFLDACVLMGALKRNLLLTLAEAEFFRVRWSPDVLEEAEAAIADFLAKKGDPEASEKAARAMRSMQNAFEEAIVTGYNWGPGSYPDLPDPDDAHVVAAAVRAQAQVIVIDNVRDFPAVILVQLDLDILTSDAFLADQITLDPGRAIPAIQRMRTRLKNPELTTDSLLLKMEEAGLLETVDMLREFATTL